MIGGAWRMAEKRRKVRQPEKEAVDLWQLVERLKQLGMLPMTELNPSKKSFSGNTGIGASR